MTHADNGDQNWILTHSGIAFDLVNLDADSVDIEDIAFSLGGLCRYTGHPEPFYSVAAHSVIGSQFVSKPAQLHMLMHDSAEAYTNDLTPQVKRMCPEFKLLENRVLKIIYDHFGFDLPSTEIYKEVKEADLRMHITERKQIMPEPPIPWQRDHPDGPYDYRLPVWSPKAGQLAFLMAFEQLRGEE